MLYAPDKGITLESGTNSELLENQLVLVLMASSSEALEPDVGAMAPVKRVS
jgi:hypothetical protein